MLAVSMIGSLTIGMVLGQVFRVMVLFPTSLVVAFLVLGESLQQSQDMLHALLEAGATVIILQVGYIFSLPLHNLFPNSIRPLGRIAEPRPVRGHGRNSWDVR